jgi:hypothetical protein
MHLYRNKRFNQKNLEAVVDMAHDIRQWAEGLYAQFGNKGNCTWQDDMCGLCAIASFQLLKKARRRRFPVKMRQGWGHAYNRYGPYFIDITATQFDIDERVLVFHQSELQEIVNQASRAAWSDTDTACFSIPRIEKLFERWKGPEHPIEWRDHL